MLNHTVAGSPSIKSSHVGQAEQFLADGIGVDVDNSKGTTRKRNITLAYWVNNTANYRFADLLSSQKPGRSQSRFLNDVDNATAVLFRYIEDEKTRFTEQVFLPDHSPIRDIEIEWTPGLIGEDEYSVTIFGK